MRKARFKDTQIFRVLKEVEGTDRRETAVDADVRRPQPQT